MRLGDLLIDAIMLNGSDDFVFVRDLGIGNLLDICLDPKCKCIFSSRRVRE